MSRGIGTRLGTVPALQTGCGNRENRVFSSFHTVYPEHFWKIGYMGPKSSSDHQNPSPERGGRGDKTISMGHPPNIWIS